MQPPYKDTMAPPNAFKVPKQVKRQALRGVKLRRAKFKGGTKTGWKRGEQLSGPDPRISLQDLRVIRGWFARHGPDAENGGTSYPGFKKWIKDGCPGEKRRYHAWERNKYRGAVAYLLWGGDAAYKWIRTPEIKKALKRFSVER